MEQESRCGRSREKSACLWSWAAELRGEWRRRESNPRNLNARGEWVVGDVRRLVD